MFNLDPIQLTVLVVIAALAVYVFGLAPPLLRMFGMGLSKAKSAVTRTPATAPAEPDNAGGSTVYPSRFSQLPDSDAAQPTPAEAFEAVCVLHRRMHACQIPTDTCKRVCDEITSLILFHGNEPPLAAPQPAAAQGGAA